MAAAAPADRPAAAHQVEVAAVATEEVAVPLAAYSVREWRFAANHLPAGPSTGPSRRDTIAA
jgi:hypothetical protein